MKTVMILFSEYHIVSQETFFGYLGGFCPMAFFNPLECQFIPLLVSKVYLGGGGGGGATP